MNIEKWLKRIYRNSYEYISNNLDDYMKIALHYNKAMKVCELLEDYFSGFEIYRKGTIFLLQTNKVYYKGKWNGKFDRYALFKCIDENLTSSGYYKGLFAHNNVEYKILYAK